MSYKLSNRNSINLKFNNLTVRAKSQTTIKYVCSEIVELYK